MLTYILKKLMQLIPTLFGVVTVIFITMRLIPGDATSYMASDNLGADALQGVREQLGLDVPIWRQYIDYIGGLFQFDLGTAFISGLSINTLIGEAFPITITIAICTIVLAFIVAVPLGTIAALLSHRGKDWLDRFVTWFAMLIDMMPGFWVALLLMLLFTLHLGWLPATGPVQFDNTGDLMKRLALPIIILASGQIAILARITRAAVLEVLSEDYIRTARALGTPEIVVVFRHALRNASLPIVTIVGIAFGNLLSGTIITEFIFSLPGMGTLLINGINSRDYSVVQSVILVYSVLFILVNLFTDLVYKKLDPRVQF